MQGVGYNFIGSLALHHRRKIARFLLLLFYAQLVLPAEAFQSAQGVTELSGRHVTSISSFPEISINTNKSFDFPTEESIKDAKNSEISEARDVTIPDASDKSDIDGPGQPEMSSFRSVNGNNLVDLFTGDFSYNIPLMDVGGYPINIHYSSGISMDQEASWVGLGWNINPGTINRSMRGLPDDFNGSDSIARTQNVRINKTVGVSLSADWEIKGLPIGAGVGAKAGVFHNTYNGWGLEYGFNAAINLNKVNTGSLTKDAATANFGDTVSTAASAGIGVTNNSQTGLDISPSLSVNFEKSYSQLQGRGSLGLSSNYNSRAGISGLQLNAEVRSTKRWDDKTRQEWPEVIGAGSSFPYSAGISFAVPSYTPSITMPITNTQFAFTGKVGLEKYVAHPSLVAVTGYVNKQEIKPEDRRQAIAAYGYLYLTKSASNPNSLQDFNREKELQFNYKTTPHIAIPQYTYDAYSISGEGTGGMFRPYRGDIGYVRDQKVRSKSKSDRFSIDLGFTTIFHGGVDYMYTQSFTQNSGWEQGNDLNKFIKFRTSDTSYQAVYFRNPGEKTTNNQAYYESVGDDALLRVKLNGSGGNVRAGASFLKYKGPRKTGEIPVVQDLSKQQRDKRTQVIQYLTAGEARLFGLDTAIISYPENWTPTGNCSESITPLPRIDGIRKTHHLSEIRVLNGDGRRYVYGIPVYNFEQRDVTFSVEKENSQTNIDKGLVGYQAGADNSVSNNKGKDNYFMQDSIPAYAHSFLLSGILSPDYVDIKGDGITEDDLGDAIKFNYSKRYGDPYNYFEWRVPFESSKANYNEGLRTYSRDDKGTYMYGRKEIWYLNSVESKTMIAVFKIVNDRQDAFSVNGVNGGLNTSKPLWRLDKIDLFAKADLIKNESNAKPVKTVHFAYTYDLCKGFAGDPAKGKLTLDSIWFSYNGNEKGRLNPYVFRYHPGADGKPLSEYNPAYNPKQYDRWGNYKDPSGNPGGLNNVDYPYTRQDSLLSGRYAAAWQLSEIQLPSGGKMKVTYESDDYGFVQYKRAAQLLSINAITNAPATTSGNQLYLNTGIDNNYLFIQSPVPLASDKDVFTKYLKGVDYIYFKIAVKMPDDRWGTGYEWVPGYAKVEAYGLVQGTTDKFWLKMQNVEGQSPMARAAIEFLRLNLPSKAYPSSELGDNIDLKDAVMMLASGFREIRNSINGFNKATRDRHLCKYVDLSRSYIRLADPDYKKYGGGLRVKRIEIFDNWKKMTNQRESVYGQEYNYTTTMDIDGQQMTISSGVATYEPMIGSEENPFRTPIEYAEKLAPMAPVNHLYSEMPIGETYFPAASVGYSKVRVRTINAKAKSANGWEETEFFTSKDFPTLVEHTLLDDEAKKRYNPKLRNFLRIDAVQHINLSQGFKVELNDMNGRVKSQSTYAENDSVNPIAYTRNFYKVDDERSPQKHLNNTVWVVDSLNGHINKNGLVGKDIEVMVDMREQLTKSEANNKSANLDVIPGFGLIPIIPLTSMIPLPQKEELRFRSAATVKIIQRYGVLDSVIVMDKGSIVSTKNLVYDSETGEVVLSRTNNEFNDPVYSFSYPAYWAYSGMGMAYKNIDAVFSNLRLINGRLIRNSNNQPFPVENFFESGDEIELKGIIKASNDTNCLDLDLNSPGIAIPEKTRIWAIDAAKGKENDKGIFFIDKEGKPLTCQVSSMRILRSGKRNYLDASVGNIVAMANPVQEVSPGNFRLVFDTVSKVVNTSAVTYKDLWQVENTLYEKDTVIQTYRNFTVLLNPVNVSRKAMKIRGDGTNREDIHVDNVNSIMTSYDYVRGASGCNSRTLRSKTMVTFDFGTIPSGANITQAKITLSPRRPELAWPYVIDNGCNGGNKKYSFNWSTATNYYLGDARVNLQRISSAWNQATIYESVVGSSSNQVLLDQNLLNEVTCTALIQDAIGQPNYGFLFDIVKQHRTSDNTSETNYLSTCAKNETNVNLPNCGEYPMPCNCYLPVLTISYTTLVDTTIKVCRYNINDTSVNPYRWGILGNWRLDRAYTYYHDRQESIASSDETDIRREGLLKSFDPYWKFTDSVLRAAPDTSKWVWNSTLSMHNRKGFEVENYDPLGRFNAGLYGYNQTLPVAVTQNSKYREILFDSFEDYDYKTKNCLKCTSEREFDFVTGQSGVSLTESESHSGKYSMKVIAGSQSILTVPITSYSMDTVLPRLSVKVDSTYIPGIVVNGQGGSLDVSFWGYLESSGCNTTGSLWETKPGPINYFWGPDPPYPGLCTMPYYDVYMTGKLQAPYSDFYTFSVNSGSIMTAALNWVTVAERFSPGEASGTPIYLEAGQLYDLYASVSFVSGQGFAQLKWSRSMNPIQEIVPANLIYPSNFQTPDSAGSVTYRPDYYCTKLNTVKPQNIIRPKFSPSQNSKMLISAWVKMDGNDCNTAPALENVIVANFNPAVTDIPLQKTGVRIEGWQRYEAVVTVPSAATQLFLSARGVQSRTVFVDDIRVQPYNSNMKSFVYDPVSVRVMAELDGNNYASFFEYDDDGTLIRVKKETERGIMTVQETRSALLKEN